MLPLNLFTLNKNDERLTGELSSPSEDLVTLTKLQVALGAWLVFGPLCWSSGLRPRHIVPDRGRAVATLSDLCIKKCYFIFASCKRNYVFFSQKDPFQF